VSFRAFTVDAYGLPRIECALFPKENCEGPRLSGKGLGNDKYEAGTADCGSTKKDEWIKSFRCVSLFLLILPSLAF